MEQQPRKKSLARRLSLGIFGSNKAETLESSDRETAPPFVDQPTTEENGEDLSPQTIAVEEFRSEESKDDEPSEESNRADVVSIPVSEKVSSLPSDVQPSDVLEASPPDHAGYLNDGFGTSFLDAFGSSSLQFWILPEEVKPNFIFLERALILCLVRNRSGYFLRRAHHPLDVPKMMTRPHRLALVPSIQQQNCHHRLQHHPRHFLPLFRIFQSAKQPTNQSPVNPSVIPSVSLSVFHSVLLRTKSTAHRTSLPTILPMFLS